MPHQIYLLIILIYAGYHIGRLIFFYLKSAQAIQNAPAFKIRYASQEYVKLLGTIEACGDLVTAPLTGTSCCWYQYIIERRRGYRWSPILIKNSDQSFLLSEEGCECLIVPPYNTITDGGKIKRQVSKTIPENLLPKQLLATSMFSQRGLFGWRTKYRITETCFFPGDTVYALGLFRIISLSDDKPFGAVDQNSLVGAQPSSAASKVKSANKLSALKTTMLEKVWTKIQDYKKSRGITSQLVNLLIAPDMPLQPYVLSSRPLNLLAKRYRLLAFFWTLVILFSGVFYVQCLS